MVRPAQGQKQVPPERARVPGPPGPVQPERLKVRLAQGRFEDAEKELIRSTLKMVQGNREQAAGILGIGERTLYRKIKEYGLTE